MNKIFIFILMWLCSFQFQVVGQEKQRIAVSPATGNADSGVKSEVEEALLEAVSNEGTYILVERSKFAQIQREQEFQQSGFVDDEQIVEVGRLAGAELMLLLSVNQVGSYYKIRYRLVNISTGTVLNSMTKDASVGNIFEVISTISKESLWKTNKEEKGGSEKICGLEIEKQDAGEYFLSPREQKRKITNGWRLPTVKELKCMCENKEKIGGFNYGTYWSSESKNRYGIGVQFNSCLEVNIQIKASVRYVK